MQNKKIGNIQVGANKYNQKKKIVDSVFKSHYFLCIPVITEIYRFKLVKLLLLCRL